MKILRELILSLCVGLMIFPVQSVRLSPNITFTVTSLADTVDANPGDGQCADAGGNCTLRAAVMEANLFPGEDTINLPAETIYFNRSGALDDAAEFGDLDITGNLTINGAGADKTIIDGSGLEDRLFDIQSGADVTITGVNIAYGEALEEEFDCGGGIRTRGTLMFSDSKFVSNKAVQGGGLCILESDAFISNSTIIGNEARDRGGGIFKFRGTLKITQSTIVNNKTGYDGGGILQLHGPINISNSTIYKNNAESGGGIYVQSGKLFLENSTISGNKAHGNGGGIHILSGSLNAYNVTIVDNHANFDREGGGESGGVKIKNGQANLYNTILAQNKRHIETFYVPDDCKGILNTLSYSLLTSKDGCIISEDDNSKTVPDPKIGLLADNGSPTQTHALLEGSPAIDAGNPEGCKDRYWNPLTTDSAATRARTTGTTMDRTSAISAHMRRQQHLNWS